MPRASNPRALNFQNLYAAAQAIEADAQSLPAAQDRLRASALRVRNRNWHVRRGFEINPSLRITGRLAHRKLNKTDQIRVWTQTPSQFLRMNSLFGGPD